MYPDLCTLSLLLYPMVLKTISPGCGVRASLMLFSFIALSLFLFIFGSSYVLAQVSTEQIKVICLYLVLSKSSKFHIFLSKNRNIFKGHHYLWAITKQPLRGIFFKFGTYMQ